MAGSDGRPGGSFARAGRPGTIGKSQDETRRATLHAPGRLRIRTKESIDPQRFCNQVKGIADTGFLVAFANRNDIHHLWAINLASQVTEPLLTCEAVLAESAFHLQDVSVVLKMIESGLVVDVFDFNANLAHLAQLAEKYASRQPDLADLCLIRLSELNPRHRVITIDLKDFSIYRRNKREIIPLICPAEE
jgi:predicted nucleic acid-binding protein